MTKVDFFKSLDVAEKTMIKRAINGYGNGNHQAANEKSLQTFDLVYVAHCLGRMYQGLFGAEVKGNNCSRDYLVHHEYQEQILEKIKKALKS